MAPTDFPSETFAATRPHRPNVMATRHAVAGGHPWTVQAGFEILEAGGNAFDAGVAMGIATNVLESQFTSFSGVAPHCMRRSPGGRETWAASRGSPIATRYSVPARVSKANCSSIVSVPVSTPTGTAAARSSHAFAT